MSLSLVERATLSGQFRILEKLTASEDEAKDFSYRAEILEEGYERLYDEALSLVATKTHSEEEGQELFDILNMYRQIDTTVNSLTETEASQLDLKNAEFKGLDANNDSQYRFLLFVVQNGRYAELKDRYLDLNSHSTSTLYRYREMLSIYNTFSNAGGSDPLSLSDMKLLMEVI